jgi:hypothetical protein
LPDCTHISDRRLPIRRRWLAGVLVASVVVAAWLPASGLADGDPASDVLASQPLFLPQDAGIAAARQAQLGVLLSAARRSGYPIRVALIASSADLGSVTALWRQPENYARFLGQELTLVNRAALLVVMPNGFGLYGAGQALAGDRSALHGIALSPRGESLASAALTAVQRLSAAAGHPLSVPDAVAASRTTSASLTPWIVFAIGTALILAAWTASLRARPLRRGA